MELWTLIVAIAAIAVSTFVAYHIAVRQGVFAKSSLYVSFAPPAEEELPRVPTQVVLIAVPRSSRERLVVGLPLIAQNASFANALGALVASRAGATPDWSADECLRLKSNLAEETGGAEGCSSPRRKQCRKRCTIRARQIEACSHREATLSRSGPMSKPFRSSCDTRTVGSRRMFTHRL